MGSETMDDPGELAALVIGQMCHDLAGPVGAILNGAEMLQDTRIDSGEIIGILSRTAGTVGTILQFYRLACGSATMQPGMQEAETIEQLATDFLSGRRIAFGMTLQPQRLPNDAVRLLLGTLYLASKALPRGGCISVNMGELEDKPEKQALALDFMLEGERCGSVRALLASLDTGSEAHDAISRPDALGRLIQWQYQRLGTDIHEEWSEGKLHLGLRTL
ncbi:MAG: histidine phosphotransferase family protein [Parvibaculaceae bacterium]|nr:histidine phosphotransferase family protein [Parvibaculaceae bacterium]